MASAHDPNRERTRRGQRPTGRPQRRLGHPRIVEEQHRVGASGAEEHEVVDDYGRRFYSFRPAQRQRYDVWGFGWFWWLIFWVIVIGLIVWGCAWGWGY